MYIIGLISSMILFSPCTIIAFVLYILYWKITPLSYNELVCKYHELQPHDHLTQKYLKENGYKLTYKQAASLGFPRKGNNVEDLIQHIKELMKKYEKENNL